jgi:nicotinamidase-related amidase
MKEIIGKKNLFLGIDIEEDFVRTTGRLSVPGAEEGLKNTVEFFDTYGKYITDVALTIDDHYPTHIGLAGAWRVGKEDLKPESYPFIITKQDVLDSKVMPKYLDFDSVVNYLEAVEKTGAVHCVWPDHCIRGSQGQAIPEELVQALKRWSIANNGAHYSLIHKGYYDGAEMYSAISFADGSQPDFGKEILDAIADEDYDNIFVAGFAKDFCVRSTLQDIMKDDRFCGKLILLDDCMASINPDDEITQEIWEELEDNFGAEVWKKEDQ